ncbi:nucleoporin GLE1 [Fopius arisanus]|uniref:mRNA export factor GLE1 n=1 Tax=Fopius arisanus TaxID=64838 RepID=A0A0C9RJY2_9HYME|nr:PREDICTED: nucleoporin GLE1 [Fopius arisanus]XP_011301722.1 PREDICTED: nucleoporin GLE1 [Fopius arisanus]
MGDLSVDFDALRLSVFTKAIKISSSVDRVTLGPDSTSPPRSPVEISSENNRNSTNISPPRPTKSPGSKQKPGITFSIEKIRHENEVLRREEVLKAVDKRKKDMEAFLQRLQREKESMRVELAARREREMEAEKAKQDAEERRFAQQDELRRRHEAQLQAQRFQERQERMAKEANEHRRLKEHEECLQKIVGCRARFTENYTDIARIMTSMKNKNAIASIVGPFTSRLKEFSVRIDGLIEGGKAGGLTSNDVAAAEKVLREADEVFVACREEVNRINEEWARQEQEALMQSSGGHGGPGGSCGDPGENSGSTGETPVGSGGQGGTLERHSDGVDGGHLEKSPESLDSNRAQGRVERVESVESVPEGKGLDATVDVKAIQVYLNSKNFVERYQETFKGLDQVDPDWRHRKDCQRKLNILIKRISFGGIPLSEVFKKFLESFQGKGAMEMAFAMNLVAETIVDEVEGYAEQKFRRIYALAAIVVALWSQYADFGNLVLSYLHIKCPYTVPVVMPRFQGQSDEDFWSSRGYTYPDGTREDEALFFKRMEKLMRFYAAIITTKLPKGVIPCHPHGLGNAWTWLATILNTQPRADAIEIYPKLIKVFLEATGHSMLLCYPNQFKKMLRVLAQDYYSLLVQHSGDSNFAISPLKDFLTDVIGKGVIAPPEGQLSGNFWWGT